MTTNVHDLTARRLAVDSRWSVDMRKSERPKIIFLDDIDYQKIVSTADHVAMFAGYANVMNEWKLAIVIASLTGQYAFRKLPTKGIALLLLDARSGDVLAQHQHNPIENQATFAGTGAPFAMDCWPQCRDSVVAVEHAKLSDPLTGGVVRYFDYGKNEGTLGRDGPYNAYRQEFAKKGKVMYLDGQGVVLPIAEAGASDTSIHEVLNQLQAGQISAAAPFDGMDEDLSDDEKEKLFSSLEAAFSR